jgi:signal transduction histidine kinase
MSVPERKTAAARPNDADPLKPATVETLPPPEAAPGERRPPGPVSPVYAEMLRQTVDWIWQTDADLTLTYVSRSLSEHPQDSLGGWVGRSLGALAAAEGDVAMPSPLLLALEERRPFRDCPVQWATGDERKVCFRLTGMPYYERESGEFAGYRGAASAAVEDSEEAETSRRLMELLEAALEEKDKLERRLTQLVDHEPDAVKARLAAIAHELRTPLNAILGFSELIRDQAFGNDPERYADYGSVIHRSGQQLLRLVDRILDSAEQESEGLHIKERALDLGDLARGVVDVLADKAAARQVRLSLGIAEGLPPAFGDRRMVHQVLFHLLSRVIALAPPGLHAGVGAELEDDGIVASVWDDGTAEGVGPSVRLPDTAPHDGDDLGAVVLQHLAEAMGASLEVNGQPGHGSRATLRLPLVPQGENLEG